MDAFVVCARGLEDLLAEELKELGIKVLKKGFRGVYVPSTMDVIYKINYQSRIAIRVLKPIYQFKCPDAKALYGLSRNINWPLYLHPSQTFSIDANVTHPNLRNSLFAAQTLKDAICDSLRDKFGNRPSVSTSSPDVQINLFIIQDQATISIDTSGSPLYKRGYRQKAPSSQDEVQAPIQECLAAAILRFASYSSEEVLCDPCCGSGTFLIEAAMLATNTPSGYYRSKWGFMLLPEYEEKDWIAFKQSVDQQITPLRSGIILGSDRDSLILDHCKRNIAVAGFSDAISLSCSDISTATTLSPATLIVCNPPYGERIPLSSRFYHHFGEFVRRNGAEDVRSYLLAPKERTGKSGPEQTHLEEESPLGLSNGGIETNLHVFKPPYLAKRS